MSVAARAARFARMCCASLVSLAALACDGARESDAAAAHAAPTPSATRSSVGTSTASAPDATVDASDTTVAATTLESLDLAILEPLPEHVRATPAPAPGHVFAHGTLGEVAPPTGAVALRFADLAAPRYETPSPGSTAQRPSLDAVLAPSVLAARNQRVAITGFATVERSESGHAVTLVLTPLPPACCLGRTPAVDERVHVTLPTSLAVTVDPWQPLTLVGSFAIEERTDAFGLFEGLYFLAADARVR